MARDEDASPQARLAVVLACCCTFAMGGVIFGISSLYPTLHGLGFWRKLCVDQTSCEGELTCCEEQLVRYSLVSSIAFFLADAAAAPWGELADRAGAFVCMVCAVSLSCTGMLLLALGASIGSDSITTFALLTIGASGPGVFSGGYVGGLGMVGSNASLKATLTAFEAAVFDGSALVFMIFQRASRAVGGRLQLPAVLWAGMSGVLGSAFCMVLRSAEAPPRGGDPMPSMSAVDEREGSAIAKPAPSPVAGRLSAVLLTPINLGLVATMAIYTLISSFYVQTQIDQFELLFGEEIAERISTTFDLAFPIGGFCASFPVSQLLQRVGEKEHIYWAIVFVLVNIFSIMSVLPYEGSQMGAAILFGPMRCLQWACYFQFLANERRYPPELTGRCLGFNNVAVALVGDGMPYLLSFMVAQDGWGGDVSGRYFFIKVALHAALLVAAPLPLGLYMLASPTDRGDAGRAGVDTEMTDASIFENTISHQSSSRDGDETDSLKRHMCN